MTPLLQQPRRSSISLLRPTKTCCAYIYVLYHTVAASLSHVNARQENCGKVNLGGQRLPVLKQEPVGCGTWVRAIVADFCLPPFTYAIFLHNCGVRELSASIARNILCTVSTAKDGWQWIPQCETSGHTCILYTIYAMHSCISPEKISEASLYLGITALVVEHRTNALAEQSRLHVALRNARSRHSLPHILTFQQIQIQNREQTSKPA